MISAPASTASLVQPLLVTCRCKVPIPHPCRQKKTRRRPERKAKVPNRHAMPCHAMHSPHASPPPPWPPASNPNNLTDRLTAPHTRARIPKWENPPPLPPFPRSKNEAVKKTKGNKKIEKRGRRRNKTRHIFETGHIPPNLHTNIHTWYQPTYTYLYLFPSRYVLV
ncbi:hypothetical protein B0T19DRAFT_142392 [Cercophora scortea]|uniref:Uncharacterized protein n=1 Tax=Cercophora scortea TaxID=314031 RepID=A0AAE0MIR8_9PEZI|nr:hypothetical protein B0T19DRAFT_142392 [Cercophora scortea]